MGVPRYDYVDGPEFRITAILPNSKIDLTVDFNGRIGHTEFYGSGKCSWKNTLEVWADVVLHADIPFSDSLALWKSDAGSHYSGVKGTCGDSRSLIDGNWATAKSELETRTLGGLTFFKGAVEDFLRGKQPRIEKFDWDIIE